MLFALLTFVPPHAHGVHVYVMCYADIHAAETVNTESWDFRAENNLSHVMSSLSLL